MVMIRVMKIEARKLLQIGEEMIEISDYNLKSSADGTTELSIVIKGDALTFESSANLKV